jgi:hypothetical protein
MTVAVFETTPIVTDASGASGTVAAAHARWAA